MKHIARRSGSAAVAAFAVWILFARGGNGEIVNGIAAKVGSSIITINEFNKAYRAALKQARLQDSESPSKKTVMDGLVDDLLVRKEGERRGIVVADEEVDEILRTIKARNNFDDARMARQLELEGLTMEGLRAQYANELMKSRLINVMGTERGLEIGESEVRAFYDDPANRERLSIPGTASVTLSQVFVAVSPGASYRGALDAKKTAASVYERAAGGEDFRSLVLAHSSAPEKAAMGTFTREQLLVAFGAETANAILSLEEGEVLPPVRVKEGYAVILLEKKNPEAVLPYEEAREGIRGYLVKQRGEERFNAWLKDKRRITRIEYMIGME